MYSTALSSSSSSPAFAALRNTVHRAPTDLSFDICRALAESRNTKAEVHGGSRNITVPVGAERDEVQQPQHPHQQQQGWIDLARKFHVLFDLLKLLIITHSQSLNIICEVIYLISLIEVTGPASSNWMCWCLYVGSGTLGFELLLWMNLSPVTLLAINLCLLVYALASSGLLVRGSDQLLRLIQPLDDAPFSEVQFNI